MKNDVISNLLPLKNIKIFRKIFQFSDEKIKVTKMFKVKISQQKSKWVPPISTASFFLTYEAKFPYNKFYYSHHICLIENLNFHVTVGAMLFMFVSNWVKDDMVEKKRIFHAGLSISEYHLLSSKVKWCSDIDIDIISYKIDNAFKDD